MNFPYIISAFFVVFYSSISVAGENVCVDTANAVSEGSDKTKLEKFLKVQWTYLMNEFPEWATYTGFAGQNGRWTDYSEAALQRRDREAVCQLNALKKINRSQLIGEDRVTYDLSKRSFEKDIEGQKFDDEYLVLSHLGGVHMGLADTLNDMPTQTESDYKNMLSRLDRFSLLVEQNEALLRKGLAKKVTPVKMFLERVPKQFDRVLSDKIEDSPIFEPFKNIKADISAEQKEKIKLQALETIKDKVYPSLKKLKTFLEKEYIPNARESISFSDMPNGKEWYAYQVKSYTTTDQTPEELHQLGLSEVARILKEMEAVKNEVKFKGSLKEFNAYLLKDSQFFYKDKEELLTGYRDIAKRIDPELPRLFKTLPRLTYGVRAMPEYKAKEAPGAYYEGGSIESGRAGYFTANTYDLKARPKWGMEALTLHEAVPGHHFQIALAQELKDMPEIRRFGGDSTAFVEGWALYAESLGSELGFYKDPYSKYGQLTYELWRAIRLVVDTGIHSKGWSRQKAIDYFQENIAKTQLESEVEVDRYITWPGQALAYKVGELKFKELRKYAREQLGDQFDVREFHDEVLKHGTVPMNVLDTATREWVEAVKKRKKKSI